MDLTIRNRYYIHQQRGRNVFPATKMRRSNDSDCNWQRLQLVFKMAAWFALAFCWSTRNFSLSKLRSWGFTSVSARYVFSRIISYQCVFLQTYCFAWMCGFFVSLTWIRVLLDAAADRQKDSSSHNQLSVPARALVFSSSPKYVLIFPTLFVHIVLRGVCCVALACCR